MSIKQLLKKLNNQKGITGADIVIALLIIVTTLTVIGMVYINLFMNGKQADRKAGATRIATNILENMDKLFYEQIDTTLKQLSDTGIATKTDETYIISGGDDIKVFQTKIPKGYTLEISIEKPENQANEEYDFVKKITVQVKYTVDGKENEVTLNKVIEREVVRECNSPNFTEEYIQKIIPTDAQFEMYSETAKDVQSGVKIICPIQYNKTLKKYQMVEDTSGIWYSYSNKQWAKILVLESNEIENYIDSENKTITDSEVLKTDKCYVWIPSFGVKNGMDLFGGTLFQYKTTDYAILNQQQGNVSYYYVNPNEQTTWSENRGMNEGLGKWCSYPEMKDTNCEAYQLNQSQYGPMLEY